MTSPKAKADIHIFNFMMITVDQVHIILSSSNNKLIFSKILKINTPQLTQDGNIDEERESEIKFIGLLGDKGHQGPCNPYQACNHTYTLE